MGRCRLQGGGHCKKEDETLEFGLIMNGSHLQKHISLSWRRKWANVEQPAFLSSFSSGTWEALCVCLLFIPLLLFKGKAQLMNKSGELERQREKLKEPEISVSHFVCVRLKFGAV